MSNDEATLTRSNAKEPGFATREDITRTLGDLDTDKLLAILDLRPTIKDLELASLWLSGDPDLVGSRHALADTASEIVDILTVHEDEPD